MGSILVGCVALFIIGLLCNAVESLGDQTWREERQIRRENLTRRPKSQEEQG